MICGAAGTECRMAAEGPGRERLLRRHRPSRSRAPPQTPSLSRPLTATNLPPPLPRRPKAPQAPLQRGRHRAGFAGGRGGSGRGQAGATPDASSRAGGSGLGGRGASRGKKPGAEKEPPGLPRGQEPEASRRGRGGWRGGLCHAHSPQGGAPPSHLPASADPAPLPPPPTPQPPAGGRLTCPASP